MGKTDFENLTADELTDDQRIEFANRMLEAMAEVSTSARHFNIPEPEAVAEAAAYAVGLMENTGADYLEELPAPKRMAKALHLTLHPTNVGIHEWVMRFTLCYNPKARVSDLPNPSELAAVWNHHRHGRRQARKKTMAFTLPHNSTTRH